MKSIIKDPLYSYMLWFVWNPSSLLCIESEQMRELNYDDVTADFAMQKEVSVIEAYGVVSLLQSMNISVLH